MYIVAVAVAMAVGGDDDDGGGISFLYFHSILTTIKIMH